MPSCRPAALAFGLACAAALTAGCASSDVTGPPAGLPVTLTFTPAPAPPFPPAAISAGGDSVVGVVVLSTSGCYDYTASAGTAGGSLVLTVTATEADRICLAYNGSATARVTARGAPRGRYDAALQLRTVPLDGRAAAPVEVARVEVSLP